MGEKKKKDYILHARKMQTCHTRRHGAKKAQQPAPEKATSDDNQKLGSLSPTCNEVKDQRNLFSSLITSSFTLQAVFHSWHMEIPDTELGHAPGLPAAEAAASFTLCAPRANTRGLGASLQTSRTALLDARRDGRRRRNSPR